MRCGRSEISDHTRPRNKNTSPGEILPVEPEEAEWLIEVLEGPFDHYFVVPEREKSRRAKLAEKLKAAGRQPIGFSDEARSGGRSRGAEPAQA